MEDSNNFTLFYFKLYTIHETEILIHYEPSKILSKNKNRTANGNRTLFFTRVSKDPVLNKNEVHIRNVNVQIYTNKFLWLIQISLQTFQVSAILLQATAETWNLNTNNTNYKYKEHGYKYKLTDFSTLKLRRASLVQASAQAWNSASLAAKETQSACLLPKKYKYLSNI